MSSGSLERTLAMMRAQSLHPDVMALMLSQYRDGGGTPAAAAATDSPDVQRLVKLHAEQEKALQALVSVFDDHERRLQTIERALIELSDAARRKLEADAA